MSDSRKKFVPYIPATRSLPELTGFAIILGSILAIVFGAANAYLGLKTGLTVSASIPAAVISMAILRGMFRRRSILENNIVQTMTTVGEAIAAGAIFTIPALFLWNVPPSQLVVAYLVIMGGVLGVLMMVPLRRLLIVNEHETLPYPEGTACAEVLKAGETGGKNAKMILGGFFAGGLFKAIGDGFHLMKTTISVPIAGLNNGVFRLEAMPALLGVGYIIGPRIAGQMIAGQMIAGGLFASIVFIPAISFFGASNPVVLFPAVEPISAMNADMIYESYIRYIGAGAVATGGLIVLGKTLPMLFRSLRDTWVGWRNQTPHSIESISRTEQDLPILWLWTGTGVIILTVAFTPVTNIGIIGAVAIAILGFLFVTVASRIVGIVGSTSMPVSGMTIATLMVVTVAFKLAGMSGLSGMVASIIVAAIVCIAIAVAGDTSQDLKTGYLVGATPWKQQVSMLVGVIASSLFVGVVLVLFDQAYGLGSDTLPSPKAALMKVIAEGFMTGVLPWELIWIGVSLAITIEFLGLNSLVVAVGFYLPLSVSAPIMLGGLVSGWMEYRAKDQKRREARKQNGTLFASGLIAGEALISVMIALLIVAGLVNPDTPSLFKHQLITAGTFLILVILLAWMARKGGQT